MTQGNALCVMGSEIECLTVVPGRAMSPETAACRFVELIADQAPSLPAVQGIFNGYGKVYCDMGHVELAPIECDDPYLLPSIFERMQILATRAVEQLADQGIELVLANNNHSGLLTSESPYWGSHENYLTERHPRMFGSSILPFLVTRLFHGAGGIHFPTGDYLAAVRPLCMQSAVGGGTTGSRGFTAQRAKNTTWDRDPTRSAIICCWRMATEAISTLAGVWRHRTRHQGRAER